MCAGVGDLAALAASGEGWFGHDSFDCSLNLNLEESCKVLIPFYIMPYHRLLFKS